MKKLFAVISVLILPAWALQAQTLALNVQSSSQNLSVTTSGDLNFGNNLMNNQGPVSIPLNSPNTVVVSITGDERCAVDISVTRPPGNALSINGSSDQIPFTLKAAYANDGQDDTAQANTFIDNNNSPSSTTFRIEQQGNSNKPPWAGPKCRGGSPGSDKLSTAYVYIYGDITIGNIRAGTYTGNINLNVQYAD